jgi:hypothetical protein
VYVVPRVDFALYKGRSKAAMKNSVLAITVSAAKCLCVCVCLNSPGRLGAAGQLHCQHIIQQTFKRHFRTYINFYTLDFTIIKHIQDKYKRLLSTLFESIKLLESHVHY